MKAKIYLLSVVENAIDLVHRQYQPVVELYIPSKRIAFNETNDNFHCFLAPTSRYIECQEGVPETQCIGEVDVPNSMAQAMIDYITVSKRMGKTKKWYKRCVLSRDPSVVAAKTRIRKLAKRDKR